jgi:hypothetical protein
MYVLLLLPAAAGLLVWSVWLTLECSAELRRLGVRVQGLWRGSPGYLRKTYESLPKEKRSATLERRIKLSDRCAVAAVILLSAAMLLSRLGW